MKWIRLYRAVTYYFYHTNASVPKSKLTRDIRLLGLLRLVRPLGPSVQLVPSGQRGSKGQLGGLAVQRVHGRPTLRRLGLLLLHPRGQGGRLPARRRGVEDVVVDVVGAACGGHAGGDVGGLAEAVLRRRLRLLTCDGDFVQGVDVVIVVVIVVFRFGTG